MVWISLGNWNYNKGLVENIIFFGYFSLMRFISSKLPLISSKWISMVLYPRPFHASDIQPVFKLFEKVKHAPSIILKWISSKWISMVLYPRLFHTSDIQPVFKLFEKLKHAPSIILKCYKQEIVNKCYMITKFKCYGIFLVKVWAKIKARRSSLNLIQKYSFLLR